VSTEIVYNVIFLQQGKKSEPFTNREKTKKTKKNQKKPKKPKKPKNSKANEKNEIVEEFSLEPASFLILFLKLTILHRATVLDLIDLDKTVLSFIILQYESVDRFFT